DDRRSFLLRYIARSRARGRTACNPGEFLRRARPRVGQCPVALFVGLPPVFERVAFHGCIPTYVRRLSLPLTGAGACRPAPRSSLRVREHLFKPSDAAMAVAECTDAEFRVSQRASRPIR